MRPSSSGGSVVANGSRGQPRARRPGPMRRLFERIVLGIVFGLATWILERRLRKALGGKGKGQAKKSRTIELS
jgi:hypothetical protein